MELVSKKLNELASRAKGALSGLGEILNSQIFSNSCAVVLNYIDEIKGASNPIVHMHVKESTFTYEISFDTLYKKDGKVMQQERFYVVDLSGDDIPAYLVDEVKKNKSAEIRFSFDDLRTLFNERSVKIDESSSFDDLLKTCKENNVNSIRLIDRVFYTRIECFDSSNREIGTLHIGILKNVPLNVADKLYPVGTASYTVN